MIAYRRADVAELNAVGRTLLDQEGRLGTDRLRIDNVELAAGDRILCTRNDRRLAVVNGSRGTIIGVDRKRREVVVDLDDSRRVILPAGYLDAGHVAHAYALTGHKTQGLTVERAFVLADDQRALKEWGYVALSRAREQSRLYTIETHIEPDASPHRIEPAGPVERLADALTRPAAEVLALDAARTRPDSPFLSDRGRLAGQHRQLADRRRALEKERAQTSRELHRTTREFGGLGALGRARRGSSLRDEISEHRQAIACLDRELNRIDRKLRLTREHALQLARKQDSPTRDRSCEPTLERERELEMEL